MTSKSESIARILERTPTRMGPFRLAAPLGEGGFAPVFLAVEEHGGIELRTVAIKLFAPNEMAGQHGGTERATAFVRERILEEARALCRVDHPNIVRFFQVVEDEGVLGLAMEHVRGHSLAERIDQEKKLPLDVALTTGAAIASALAAVHAAGLVHRDVKPDNIIEAGGVYKLIDFGIAAREKPFADPPSVPVDVDDGAVTFDGKTMAAEPRGSGAATTNALAGTMGYIDPECVGGEAPATTASDIYSLGATLYECITGTLPSTAGRPESRINLAIATGVDAPPPLRSVAPDVPEEVAALVDALIAPKRQDRPRRAEWIATELDRLARAKGKKRALSARGPFRGLDAFTADDRDLLFGRSADIAGVVDLLRGRGLVAIVGPSGSGKTSLARAGVAPAVADGVLGAWPKSWEIVTLTPRRDAGASLTASLQPWLTGRDEMRISDALALHVEETGTGLLIVIDALEELVTVAAPETRSPMIALLEDLATNPRPGLRALVTVRRDLVHELFALGTLGKVLARGAHLVAPLSAQALGQGLEERLELYGYVLEDVELRTELDAELKTTAESMPLVEFALARLWEERDEERHVLPRAGLTRIGGLAGALEQHAEGTLERLVAASSQDVTNVVRAIFLALTTAQGTRTRKTPEELATEAPDERHERVLSTLERARLVVKDDGRYTLAHEALLGQWPRLRKWVDEVKRDREVASDVELATEKWKERHSHDQLVRGRELEDARRIAREGLVRLSPDARAFVKASFRWWLRTSAGVIGLLLALAAGGLVLAFLYFRAERETEAEKGRAREVMQRLADSSRYSNPERQKAITQLQEDKTACEKALAKCTGDAGAPR